MSSSKFASLEGVDFDSPDVFETHSPSPTRRSRMLPRDGRDRATQSSDEDSDEEGNGDSDSGGAPTRRGAKKVGGLHGLPGGTQNPDIVDTKLDPDEAARRFKEATGVDGRGVDFSSVIQRRKKRPQYYPPATFETTTYALGSGTGYQTSGGGLGPGDEEPWTSVSGAKEQPVDKFRRLRYEMEELEKDLEGSAGARSSRLAEGDAKSDESAAPDGLMDQLSTLRAQLTTMEEHNLHGLPSTSSWHIETKRLLERLSMQDAPIERHKGDLRGQVQTEGQSDTAAVGGAARYAELDKRLAGLEELIGVKDALVDETKSLPRPLLPSLARIEHLLTLLTHPRHLDGISRRIKVLVSELERLHEARKKLTMPGGTRPQQIEDKGASGEEGQAGGAAVPLEMMQRLETVLPMLSKLEPLIPVVPAVLARLHSLTALHASSNSFVADMNSLEAGMKRSHANSEELKGMLTNLEASLGENQKRVEGNLQVVETRMESITQRIERLQGK